MAENNRIDFGESRAVDFSRNHADGDDIAGHAYEYLKVRCVKQGMMHELLSGRVRLV